MICDKTHSVKHNKWICDIFSIEVASFMKCWKNAWNLGLWKYCCNFSLETLSIHKKLMRSADFYIIQNRFCIWKEIFSKTAIAASKKINVLIQFWPRCQARTMFNTTCDCITSILSQTRIQSADKNFSFHLILDRIY